MAVRRLLFELHNDVAMGRARRTFRDADNPLDILNDVQLYQRYRFDRQTIYEIVGLVEPHLPIHNHTSALPNTFKVLATLRYLGSNSFQQAVGDTLQLSKAAICTSVQEVSSALVLLAPEYIKFPTDDATVRRHRSRFYELAGFPNVVGCIDGSLIWIIKPAGFGNEYRCRKGYPALNVQGICGPDGEFLNIVAKWPGSAHDSRIFRESTVYRDLSENRLPKLLLGDSGYMCRSFILTPYRNPESETQRRYNVAHKKTRVVIEQAFGHWKRRFAILHSEMRTKIETSFSIIVSCAVLHNIAIAKRLPDFEDLLPPAVDENENDLLYEGPMNADGRAARDHFATMYFAH